MKIKNLNKVLSRSFLAVSNVGRGLLIGFSGLLLNYILLQYNAIEVLNTYVYFISVFGLFYILTNWGGKFFNIKEISKNPKHTKQLISSLISSKIILVLFCGLIILFIPLEIKTKVLMMVFLFLKSLTPIFDALIIYRKKSKIVFIAELIFNTIFLSLIFSYSSTFKPFSFLIYLIILESLKSVFYLTLLWKEISFNLSILKSQNILKKSFYFFGLSITGFLASKVDLYIIGILINKETMSYYFIISSLTSVSMVIYASVINTFETSIYRFNPSLFNKLENLLQYFGILFSIIATLGFYLVTNYFYKIPIDYKFSLLFFSNILLFTLLNFELYRYTKLEKQKVILIILIISVVINCVVSFLIIKKLLLIGAFLANTLGVLFNYIFLRLYYKKILCHEI
ncbi:hypothetical protein [Olleya sp. Bg11-27]|uniref:hypothetical protein n=1 Tax=Olleya sp. Bg11-27 TaxID=2058135 RepID=UPI000C317FE0|nr:hypothetical protein [Olleya sp. Bg11-27]AUC77158.1 hypothetical protein CW732_16335 [Olleya sp. Bg11-27]